MTEEVWGDVPGFIGLYQVSNHGRIYSVRYKRFRKLRTDKYGYAVVPLNKDGVQRRFFVHRLVAEVFLQNPLELPEVNHIDGNKQNNFADNLEWCNHQENIVHAYETGLMKQTAKPKPPKKSQKYKLSKSLAQQIRAEYAKGEQGCGFKALAKKYSVSTTTIRQIVKNKMWREL